MLRIKNFVRDTDSVISFNNSQDFLIISKKTGRLASAIYLLTDFLPDTEPLKWSVRKWSLRIITETLSLKNVYTAERKIHQLDSVKVDIERVISLLELAQMSGLISEMNFRIILGELINLMKLEEEYVDFALKPRDTGYSLSKDAFSEEKEEVLGTKDTLSYRNVLYHKGHFKDKFKNRPTRAGFSKLSESKDTTKRIRTERQVKILDIVKDKKEVSIKDITDLIKDCSEKTIQRELASMISSGILRRNGKRRWSKYMLNL